MVNEQSLAELTSNMAEVLPSVDANTTGQYGDGIGSEEEERQVELLVDALRDVNDRYTGVKQEVPYPEGNGRCDLVLPDGTPVELKLIRYWRANGDPEPMMYSHVFSPFHRNTLLTDAKDLYQSAFDELGALIGVFYSRSDDDSRTVEGLPTRYTADEIAEKIVADIDYWYGIDVSVCEIARFSGLQHPVHQQGALITWQIE